MLNRTSHVATPLPPPSKSVLRIVFLTLFLDLIGFSIVFPLFPDMLAFYLHQEGDQGLIGLFHGVVNEFSQVAGGPEGLGTVVLFGGLLGSLYSLLQFVFAPILGALSDRYGRKPILVVSLAGIALSYGLWFFAGSFYLLVLSRLIGGIMSGNISTASAVVADVTTPGNRSKGMAIIGMAIGLGFIVGPALGGFSALIDLTAAAPWLASWGVNPFSMPALVALVLTVINLLFVIFRFPETYRPDTRVVRRTINLLHLVRTQGYPGINRTNFANFFFLIAFSGMEFSLTFLAKERFDFGPKENAFLFLFAGLVLAVVQGTYVRAFSTRIGVKRMTMHGLLFLMPGLLLVGVAGNLPVLFTGLFLMAWGGGQVIPCLSSLVSLYAPLHEQGRILGIFRSFGALARGIGPIVACLLFWRLGSSAAYVLGAASLIIPFMLAWMLPKPSDPVEM
jgi:MFS family permease